VSIRRPLSSATTALRGAAPVRRRHGAEFLAELLDFDGAVQLSRALEATPAPVAAPSSPELALARAQRRLTDVEREARLPLHDPHTGLTLVPASRLQRALERAGAPASRQRKAIAAAARELFAPVEARTVQRIATVRRLVREVREEIAPAVAASGPVAARLEQLDAALAGATAARSDALFGRAVISLGDGFAADLEQVVIELPRPCAGLPVAAWTGPGGVVADHIGRCEALIAAVFLHERARVDMLLRSTLQGPAGSSGR